MKYDLISCAGCRQVRSADPGHALCRECEGYGPRRWGTCAVCRFDGPLVPDRWFAGYRSQETRWVCNPCDSGRVPVNTQEGMGR